MSYLIMRFSALALIPAEEGDLTWAVPATLF